MATATVRTGTRPGQQLGAFIAAGFQDDAFQVGGVSDPGRIARVSGGTTARSR